MNKRIAELTKLVLEGKMCPEKQAVEYDRRDLFLDEDTRNAKRIYEYVTAQKPVLTRYSLMTGLFSFDGTVPGDAMSTSGLKHTGEMYNNFYCKPIDDISTCEWQHATADYSMIIRKGIGGFIEDIEKSKANHQGDEKAVNFLNALKTVAQALIAWAHKCSTEAAAFAQTLENEEKENLLKLSETLKKIPEKPAETFYEAVLSIYVCFSYDPDSLGTLDRTLYDYYKKDIERGALSREKAKEYLQELFLMLQSKTPLTSKNFTRGGESHFCVGGYLPDGTDGFNELSMLILEALMELPTYIPQISLRWTKKLPFETFKKVMDFERNDANKRIAFVNDEVKMHGIMHIADFTYEQACRYTSVGCNEVAFPGGMVGGSANANGAHSIQNVFYERTADVLKTTSFDEFFAICKEELERDLIKIIDYDNKYNLVRSRDTCYVTSLLFPDCITYAKPYSQGVVKLAIAGNSVMGITNVIDSLSVVKQFVFDEKIVTMETLVNALKADWEGFEDLRLLIQKKGKFFGNDDETSNYVARLFTEAVYDILKDKRSIWGYKLRVGNLQGYNPHHEWFGKLLKATPDGRKSGEMLKFGLGQSEGYDRNGLNALLNSVAKCDPHGIITSGSSVTNVYLDSQLIKNDENFEKTAKIMETYFLNGGAHFQLNYISREDLIDAKVKPENHKNLRVRVSGFSDYFVNLVDSVQDDIIERTVHS